MQNSAPAERQALKGKLPSFFYASRKQHEKKEKSSSSSSSGSSVQALLAGAPGSAAAASSASPAHANGNGRTKGLASTLAFIPNPLAQWHNSHQDQDQQQQQQRRCDAALALQLQQEERDSAGAAAAAAAPGPPNLALDSALAWQLQMGEQQLQELHMQPPQPQLQDTHRPPAQGALLYPSALTESSIGNNYELVCARLSRTPSYGLTPRVNSFIPRPQSQPGSRPSPAGPPVDGVLHVNADRDRLLLRLEQYDLTERQVVGDGACQFRSLSDQLYGSQEHHAQVRDAVLQHLKQHPERYSMYVPSQYDVYCSEMAKPGTWGDHVTLQAAADVYGLMIMVLTSFKQESVIKIQPLKKQSARVLWLSFWAEVHYNSIYPCAAPPPG